VVPTPDPGASLKRCFGDDTQDFEQAWQRAPLAGHDRSGAAFADLLDVVAVDRLVTERALRHPAFRMVRDGETLDRGSYTSTRRWGATRYDGVLDPVRVAVNVADGATLVLQSLHTWWAPLGRFCADLHAALGHPVQANAYLTPPDERGLGLHYDTHDVVVLQTLGHKRWEVFEPRHPLPLNDQHWSSVAGGEELDDGSLTPVLQTVLGPGDCLYVPRGFVHRVVSEDESSLHVTVGIHARTWHHLLARLVDQAKTDRSVREALPPEVLRGEASVDDATLERQLKALLADADLDAEVAAMGRSVWTQYAGMHTGTLEELLVPPELDDLTVLRRRPGPIELEERADGRLALVRPDKAVVFPPQARPALERVVAAEGAWALGDLADVLDDASRVVLGRRLLREGILRRDG
jgi:mannose-6-phosphate isomerase-like protein (cupin superfamily)